MIRRLGCALLASRFLEINDSLQTGTTFTSWRTVWLSSKFKWARHSCMQQSADLFKLFQECFLTFSTLTFPICPPCKFPVFNALRHFSPYSLQEWRNGSNEVRLGCYGGAFFFCWPPSISINVKNKASWALSHQFWNCVNILNCKSHK